MPYLISVIVTTYNREDALEAVLRSLMRQTDPDFEVVVADDGSRPATADLIAAWRPKLGHPLAHVWHEDRGFRAAEIRNRAILASHGAYCIFLDGDCIARPDFVATHRRLAEPGWFVTGNRILLSRELTANICAKSSRPSIGACTVPRAAGAGRHQSRGGVAAIAAWAVASVASARLARRPFGQSRGVAHRFSPRRRLRCRLSRVGPGRFRYYRSALAIRRQSERRGIRNGRLAPVASRKPTEAS